MLTLLLDENISWQVTEQLNAKEPRMQVQSVYQWRGGELIGQSDAKLLRAANDDRLTLVTYDLKTIPQLLREMAADSEEHAGIVFVDRATIRNNDFGGLIAALLAHWRRYGSEEWTNRVAFLEAGR